LLAEIVPWMRRSGVTVVLDRSSAEEYSCGCPAAAQEEFASLVDAVAVLGGDGTLLYAARLVGATGVPILGINLGSLGFLAEVKPEDIRPAFEALLAGACQVQERMLLDVEMQDGGRSWRALALNEATIYKGAPAHMIELEILVDSEVVTVTRADGLIIATPTGSTAYSLSAGGPILFPTLEALIITPICPHTLTNRPVVVPDSVVIEVRLRRGENVRLTVDGQVDAPITEGRPVVIRKAASSLRLLHPAGSAFFRLLREKLKWG